MRVFQVFWHLYFFLFLYSIEWFVKHVLLWKGLRAMILCCVNPVQWRPEEVKRVVQLFWWLCFDSCAVSRIKWFVKCVVLCKGVKSDYFVVCEFLVVICWCSLVLLMFLCFLCLLVWHYRCASVRFSPCACVLAFMLCLCIVRIIVLLNLASQFSLESGTKRFFFFFTSPFFLLVFVAHDQIASHIKE